MLFSVAILLGFERGILVPTCLGLLKIGSAPLPEREHAGGGLAKKQPTEVPPEDCLGGDRSLDLLQPESVHNGDVDEQSFRRLWSFDACGSC
jgi:hypothetical protein